MKVRRERGRCVYMPTDSTSISVVDSWLKENVLSLNRCFFFFFFFFCFFFYESLYVMHTGHTITTQLIPVCALLNTTTSI